MTDNEGGDTNRRDDGTRRVHDYEFDPGTESVTERVVTAVAERSGTDPIDAPLLYDEIDPEALEELFADVSGDRTLEVRFTYGSHEVTVTSDGTIRIVDPGERVGRDPDE